MYTARLYNLNKTSAIDHNITTKTAKNAASYFAEYVTTGNYYLVMTSHKTKQTTVKLITIKGDF
jgi:hypothetical protein